MARHRHGKSTLQRIYEIGGADLALRYNEIASGSKDHPREYRLISLRFYTRALPEAERQFGSAFPRSATTWMYFEAEVENPWSSIRTDHQVRVRFFRPDGRLFGSEIQEKIDTEEGQRTFLIARGRGWEEPGNWMAGVYRIEIDVAWKLVGTGDFTIYDDAPQFSVPAREENPPGTGEFSALDELIARGKAFFGESSEENKDLSKKPAGATGLGFDGWMERLKADFPAFSAPSLDPGKPLDDIAKMRWLTDIDRRYRFAIPNARVGRANASVVQELRTVVADYEKLLTAGAPKYQIYTEESVREKIANTHSWIARAAEAMRDHRVAEREYLKAAELFGALGKTSEVERCRASLASLKYSEGGNVNTEITRLRAQLARTPAGSLAYAETLAELAGIISSGGLDDHEAKKLYHEAEGILTKLTDEKGKTIGNPSGTALADALTNSLLNLGKSDGPSAIERMLKVNGLQQQVYLGLGRIYDKTDQKKAEQYRRKAGKIDTPKVNSAFTEAMLRALKGELGEI